VSGIFLLLLIAGRCRYRGSEWDCTQRAGNKLVVGVIGSSTQEDAMDISNDTNAKIDSDEMKIVVNALHLSMDFLLSRVAEAGGEAAALSARHDLIENLRYGNINMAIMEDPKIFDFVLSVVEALPEERMVATE